MADTYIVLNNSDGEILVTIMSKQELEKALADQDFGDNAKFLDHLPRELTAVDGKWIIKGALVTPRPVEIVKKLEVP